MVACFVVSLTIGQFISSVLAFQMAGDWRTMFGLAAVPAFLQLVLMAFMPESQRWLANKEREDDCAKVLSRVYDED